MDVEDHPFDYKDFDGIIPWAGTAAAPSSSGMREHMSRLKSSNPKRAGTLDGPALLQEHYPDPYEGQEAEANCPNGSGNG